jgi:hypothetical protein
MTAELKLNDAYADARFRLIGTQRYAYLIGGDKVAGGTPEIGDFPAGTDILLLNYLKVPFSFIPIQNHLRKAGRLDLGEYQCVFNGVTNPDTNPKVLTAMAKVLKPFKGRVINHPAAVLKSGRDAVARRLRGISGLYAPTAVRFTGGSRKGIEAAIEKAGVTFPAILRAAGAHLGAATLLVHRMEDLPDLKPARDYYLISFVDYRSPDGLYRKTRFFFLGDEVVIRDQFISEHWNVQPAARRGFMATRPDLIEEERRLIAAGFDAFPPAVPAILDAVRSRVGLDFFGLDCGFLRDGTLVLFEANASMNFSPASERSPFEYLHTRVELGRAGFRSLLSPNYRSRVPRMADAASPERVFA